MAGGAADPYDGLDDEEVLARANAALRKAWACPPGSVQWAVQWAVYDAASAELRGRLDRYVAAHPPAARAVRAALARAAVTAAARRREHRW
jgi:hypothetical protein